LGYAERMKIFIFDFLDFVLKIMKVIEHSYEHQERKKEVGRSDWLDLCEKQ
jgi:hypothetical protein